MSMFHLDLGQIGGVDDNHGMSSSLLTQTISPPPEMPQTKNVVATVNVKCKLDLKEIHTKTRNSEYNPKRFAAVVMRIRDPKSTALIFASGKIVITGAKTPNDAYISSRKFVKILQKLEFPAKWTDYKIVNVVSSCSCGFPVRLESFAHFKSQNTSYEPELFPGLIYRMKQPKVAIIIFVSGKIVLTGARSPQEIDQSFKLIWPILQKFKKQGMMNNGNHNMDVDNSDIEEEEEEEEEEEDDDDFVEDDNFGSDGDYEGF